MFVKLVFFNPNKRAGCRDKIKSLWKKPGWNHLSPAKRLNSTLVLWKSKVGLNLRVNSYIPLTFIWCSSHIAARVMRPSFKHIWHTKDVFDNRSCHDTGKRLPVLSQRGRAVYIARNAFDYHPLHLQVMSCTEHTCGRTHWSLWSLLCN